MRHIQLITGAYRNPLLPLENKDTCTICNCFTPPPHLNPSPDVPKNDFITPRPLFFLPDKHPPPPRFVLPPDCTPEKAGDGAGWESHRANTASRWPSLRVGHQTWTAPRQDVRQPQPCTSSPTLSSSSPPPPPIVFVASGTKAAGRVGGRQLGPQRLAP